MFRSCTDDMSRFTDVAVSFISMLAEYIVPTVRVKMFPNQKLWLHPHCSEHQDHRLQCGSRHYQYDCLQSGILRHPGLGQGLQTLVPGASGVSLLPGQFTEHVPWTACHDKFKKILTQQSLLKHGPSVMVPLKDT